MESILQDTKSGLRKLLSDRGTTFLVTLMLALGIGANTAIFSALRGSLLAGLPYENADGLVMVWLDNERQGIRTDITSYPSFELTRENATTLEDLGVYRPAFSTLSEGEPERVQSSQVGANVLGMLGVEPVRGRLFENREDLDGEEPTAILSDGLWRRRYGGDPDVVGTRIIVDGEPRTVVGVMPPGFDFPGDTELWMPMSLSEGARTTRSFWLYQIGRLRPGTTAGAAQREMNSIAELLLEANPRLEGYHRLYVQTLRDHMVGDVRTPLMLLSMAAGLVLLIACSNVAHLLLARSSRRERELSIRLALGATRGRLVRLLQTESVILALAGGALGAVLAFFGLRGLLTLGPDSLTRLGTPAVDMPVLIFCLLLSLAVGQLVGLLPALQISGSHLTEALKDGGHGTAGARRRRWWRRGLVSGEVALALVLLVCAGLLLRSFDRLLSVDRGFRTAGILTMDVSLPGDGYAEADRRSDFYREVVEQLSAFPEVEMAAATSGVLLPELANSGTVSIEGQPDRPDGERIEVTFDVVTPGFFETVGTSILAGRDVQPSDDAQSISVAVVNEAMARRYWGSAEDALDRRFGSSQNWVTVVGVVADARRTSLELSARPSAYRPHTQQARPAMTLVVRARSGLGSTQETLQSLVPLMRRTVRAVNPSLPLGEVGTLEAELSDRVAARRFNTVLLATFAGLALVLSLVGIYGVVAQWVEERTPEIGVRIALGAGRGEVVRWVLGQGLLAPVIGLGVGLALSFVATRSLRSMLFEVAALDPITYLLVPVLVLLVATAATLWPALRACWIDPVRALQRSE